MLEKLVVYIEFTPFTIICLEVQDALGARVLILIVEGDEDV
jgi:hypothetical protein